jgi:hypothetical protein
MKQAYVVHTVHTAVLQKGKKSINYTATISINYTTGCYLTYLTQRVRMLDFLAI